MSSSITLKNLENTEFKIEHKDGRGAKTINGSDIAIAVDTINDFPTNPNDGDVCIVRDLNRGGTFIYDSTEVANSNDGTNFNGWTRQYSGAVNVKWFGASTSKEDNDIYIQNALGIGESIFIPKDTNSYKISSPIIINIDGQKIYSDKAELSFSASYNTSGGTVLKMFEVNAVDDVDFNGLMFDMTPNAGFVGGGGSFGIRYLSGCNRGLVTNCTFKNQELSSLASVTSASGSTEIIVTKCHFYVTDIAYGGGAILHSGNKCLAYGNIINNLGDSYISLDDSKNSICAKNILTNNLLDGSYLRTVGTMIQVAQGSEGCICYGNTIEGITQRGIYIFDSVGNTNDNIIVRDNILDGGGVSNPTAASNFIETDASSKNIEISGNKMFNPSNSLPVSIFIRSRTRDIKIFNNDMNANGVANYRGISTTFDGTGAGESIFVYNNTVDVTAIGIYFTTGDYTNTRQLHCYDNNIKNAAEGLKVDATNFIPKIQGNNFKDTTSKVAGTWQFNNYFNVHDSDERAYTSINNLQSVLWGTASPSSGTWKIGDKILNKTPLTDGNNMVLNSWVCVSAGTPGTWAQQYVSTVSPAT